MRAEIPADMVVRDAAVVGRRAEDGEVLVVLGVAQAAGDGERVGDRHSWPGRTRPTTVLPCVSVAGGGKPDGPTVVTVNSLSNQ